MKNNNDILVEWDDEKNNINIRKHGISFETAALVFVVYTMRGEAARIISARIATAVERDIYYGE